MGDLEAPSVYNGTAEELAQAHVWLTRSAKSLRAVSEVLATPLDPSFEAQAAINRFNSQQAEWYAGWAEAMSAEMAQLPSEDAARLWRQTQRGDEMYDESVYLGINPQELPDPPVGDFSSDTYERQSAELELYIEEHPGCADVWPSFPSP